jgi:hypothetical protein
MYQHRISPVYTFPALPIANGQTLPDPFPYLAYILAVAGSTTQIMLAEDSPTYQREQLNALQLALNGFDAALPDELRFQTATFRSYVPLLQGGAFVLIHVSPNTVDEINRIQLIRDVVVHSYGSMREYGS